MTCAREHDWTQNAGFVFFFFIKVAARWDGTIILMVAPDNQPALAM
jgi:hypothetical protein